MLSPSGRLVMRAVLLAVIGIITPVNPAGAGPGSRRGNSATARSNGPSVRRTATPQERRQRVETATHRSQVKVDPRRDSPMRHHSPSGPLSYNAYWKAATSPNPPRTNQDYNRYWQKMQAWRDWHQRQKPGP